MEIDSLEGAFSSAAGSVKEQKLIALGVAVALRGECCIARHVQDALDAGATRGELGDAVRVAVAIGGGLPTPYERRLKRALEALKTNGGGKSALPPA